MRTFDDMLAKQLQNEDFRKEHEAIQPEMDVIRAIVEARNPSVNLLKRLADGMGMMLKIEFVPKQKA